jgi:Glycosyl hydrolases family 16
MPAASGLLPGLLAAVLPAPVPADPAPPADPSPAPCPVPDGSAGAGTSAAALQGWGEPARVDEFDGTALGEDWEVYDGPGHAGNGRRTPKAVSVRDGVMTITGNARGDTAGMAWGRGQKFGRWEGRVKAPASDESYNALLLLWPDAENFPEGGEIDFMEMMDHTRQETHVFLHYGEDNRQISGKVEADGTQWHNWAVEWTPTHIATFLDGKEWWRTERVDIFPPDRMHLCVQLDWFPRSGRGEVQESTMQVDWVKQYELSPAELAGVDDAARMADSIAAEARARVAGALGR